MDLDLMRESRTSPNSIMHMFRLEEENHSYKLFCFFEGEDRKYYKTRIEQKLGYDCIDIRDYDCNGKKGVLELFRLISQDVAYKNTKVAFFIDKDFIPLENRDKRIYETPCHSVENFYVSKECFKKLLNKEYGLNKSEKDFKMCVMDYECRLNEFNDSITLFNALLCYCYINKIDTNTHDLKIRSWFNPIEIDQVIHPKSELNLINIKKKIKLKANIDEGDLNRINEDFANSNKVYRFRGKFELDFLKGIINSLNQKNRDNQYFSEKIKNVNISVENLLSTLNDVADTPDDLIQFLNNYK